MSTWTLRLSRQANSHDDPSSTSYALCFENQKINYKNMQKSTHSYSHSFFTFAQFERHNQICWSGSNALGKSQ